MLAKVSKQTSSKVEESRRRRDYAAEKPNLAIFRYFKSSLGLEQAAMVEKPHCSLGFDLLFSLALRQENHWKLTAEKCFGVWKIALQATVVLNVYNFSDRTEVYFVVS